MALKDKVHCGQLLYSMQFLYNFLCHGITKYHKLYGLKQQKFVLSQFWIPEV